MDRSTSFTVRAMPGPFGAAEIEGLHPHDTDDPEARALLRITLARHAVVCVRLSQPLDDADARSLASMVGPIKDPIGRTRDGGTIRYDEDRQIIDAGFVLTDELRDELGDLSFGGLDPLRPGLFETFHSDDTYTERPAAATVLHARALPAAPGGDTCFIDMRSAFRLLDTTIQQQLIGLRAAYSYNNGGAFPPRIPAAGPLEQLVDVTHPIVCAHPVTAQPTLYIDLDRATHVNGLPESVGRALLRQLQDHAEHHALRYAHAWRPNDVLIWDNALVQHKASGDFPVGEPRRFWRYLIEGAVPEAYVG